MILTQSLVEKDRYDIISFMQRECLRQVILSES